jgi:hypothetical protein
VAVALSWNTPGSRLVTGQSGCGVALPQLGTRVMDVTRSLVESLPLELLEIVNEPARPVWPTKTGLGKLGTTLKETAAVAGWTATLRTTGRTIPVASRSAAARRDIPRSECPRDRVFRVSFVPRLGLIHPSLRPQSL